MAYTNVWSVSNPPDTDLARNIGADIRNVRVDIQDRLNDVLVNDWTADPLVLQPEVLGNVGQKVQFYLGAGFVPNYNYILVAGNNVTNQTAIVTRTFVTVSSGPGVAVGAGSPVQQVPPLLSCTCIMPNNVTLTSFGFSVLSPNGGAISCQLWQYNFLTNATVQIGTTLTSDPTNGGAQTIQSTPGVQLTASNTAYAFNIFSTTTGINASFSLYNGFVTYSTPDCRSTI